ncbi:syntaxin-61 isoform X1 [Silene latifolia]|uniref:syntaxin-61 isoform X1 n=1 Tax=Silene latifolia TaxID=37657 RepID=UPI003D787783
MSSAQDPFYIVKEEIQDSIDKLLSSFHQWESAAYGTGEQARLTTVVIAGCESIQEQVDELDKAISVASRDPAYFGIDIAELEKRRKWTRTARDQVGTVKKKVSAGKGLSYHDSHRELMRLPMDQSNPTETSNQYGQHNDDLISSESDRQLLLIKQQDEDLDLLSDSVQRIGHIGLNIHEELLAQEKIIDDLGTEMDSTSNRLDFLQKKVEIVMKKAGAKGQIMMILFLVVLFVILFVLVFVV